MTLISSVETMGARMSTQSCGAEAVANSCFAGMSSFSVSKDHRKPVQWASIAVKEDVFTMPVTELGDEFFFDELPGDVRAKLVAEFEHPRMSVRGASIQVLPMTRQLREKVVDKVARYLADEAPPTCADVGLERADDFLPSDVPQELRPAVTAIWALADKRAVACARAMQEMVDAKCRFPDGAWQMEYALARQRVTWNVKFAPQQCRMPWGFLSDLDGPYRVVFKVVDQSTAKSSFVDGGFMAGPAFLTAGEALYVMTTEEDARPNCRGFWGECGLLPAIVDSIGSRSGIDVFAVYDGSRIVSTAADADLLVSDARFEYGDALVMLDDAKAVLKKSLAVRTEGIAAFSSGNATYVGHIPYVAGMSVQTAGWRAVNLLRALCILPSPYENDGWRYHGISMMPKILPSEVEQVAPGAARVTPAEAAGFEMS